MSVNRDLVDEVVRKVNGWDSYDMSFFICDLLYLMDDVTLSEVHKRLMNDETIGTMSEDIPDRYRGVK